MTVLLPAALRELFFARTDTFARSLPDKRDAKGKPISGPWRHTRKNDGVFETDSPPITDDHIQRHLDGTLLHDGHYARLMAYQCSEDGQAVATAVDLDVVAQGHADVPEHFATIEQCQEAVWALTKQVRSLGLVPFLEVTKGGSLRVWIFHHRLPAADAKGLGQLLLKRAGLHPKIEIFPKQILPKIVGSAVSLPYWGRATPGRQVIVDIQTGEAISAETFAPLALASRSDPSAVAAIVAQARAAGEIGKPLSPPRPEQAGSGGEPLPEGRAAEVWQHTLTKCAALAEMVETCEAGGELAYDDWLRLASHLRVELYGDPDKGGWGRREFHRLSAFDSRYEATETDALWDSLTGRPTLCANMGCGRDPQRDCGMPAGKVSSQHFSQLFAYRERQRLTVDYDRQEHQHTAEIMPEQGQEATHKDKSSAPASRAEARWPDPLDAAAFHGLAGDIVRTIEPHTEADPAALLVQLLVAFGNAIGRNAHFKAESDQHYGNLFLAIVGLSSKGRKGSSWNHIEALLKRADPIWTENCVKTGLSSGEGMIWAVRDPIEVERTNKTTKARETVIDDAGVTDKRLLCYQSEFASILHQFKRDGNTLSSIMREAWDRGKLQSMTKNSPAKATEAHVSIIAHITKDELLRCLADTPETANGLANRFLWVCARRARILPRGGNLQESSLNPLVIRLQAAMQHGRAITLLERDAEAENIWDTVYEELSEGKPGLFGAVTGRAEAQVMRLALLYALLDGVAAVGSEHLMAGLAVWEYCEASCRFIFGDATGDPVADTLLSALRAAPDGLTQTQINGLFQRNQNAARLSQALTLLETCGRIQREQRDTGGRPSDVWKAVY